MRAADPRERALVAQERMELPPLSPEDLAERRAVDLERVGPEMGSSSSSCAGVTSQTPARFFFPPSVSSSSPPSAKRTWNIGFAGPFLPAGR